MCKDEKNVGEALSSKSPKGYQPSGKGLLPNSGLREAPYKAMAAPAAGNRCMDPG